VKKSLLISLALALMIGACAGAVSAENLTIWSTLTQTSRAEMLQKIADDFAAQRPGLEVEIAVMPWGGAMDRMVAAILAGNPPDVATVGQGWPQSLAGTRGIVPLDDLVEELGEEKFLGTSLSVLGSLDGLAYSVPLYVTPHVLTYRKSWLADAGKDIPQTWEDLYDVCKAVTNVKQGRYGFAMPFDMHGGKIMWGFLLANGVTILDKNADGEWEVNVNQPAAVETLEFLAKLVRECAPPGVTTYTTNEVRELVAQGIVMTRLDTPEFYPTVREYQPETLDDFGVIPLPARKRLGSSQGWVGLVAFDTPRQKLAKEFMKFMLEEENLVDFSLSYPYAMFPATQEAYANPRYLAGVPDELKPLIPITPDILDNSSGIAMWTGDNPWAGEIENKLILPNALNNMLTTGMSAEKAVERMETEIRRLMTAQ
jgi:multiple sugar transport system substrate-binding protein